MLHTKKILTSTAMILSLGAFNAKANLYVGAEAGLSIPVSKKVKIKKLDSHFHLKNSKMLSGRLGYQFAPGKSIESSWTYQPEYKMKIDIPNNDAAKTKAKANIPMINFVYNFAEVASFTPYIIIGAGYGEVKVKEAARDLTDLEFQQINSGLAQLGQAPITDKNAFTLYNQKSRAFAWQIGLGASQKVTDNLSLDAAVKLQVLQGLKFKYKAFDTQALKHEKGSFKQSIGAWEIGIGFTYKFPV